MSITKRIGLNDNADIRDIDDNFLALDNKLSNVIVVTIPIDNWVTETDSDNVDYYTREIVVAGMTADSTPLVALKPDDSFNVNINKLKAKMFSKLLYYECSAGKIKFAITEIPANSFQVELKGV